MMTQKTIAALLVFFSVLGMSINAKANFIKDGDKLFKQGAYLKAADSYYKAYKQDPRGKKADQALFKTGSSLDVASPGIYEEADRVCYLNKKTAEATPACFERVVQRLNSRYGAGSFFYWADRIMIQYSGKHFQKILDEYPKSSYRADATFKMFRGKNLLQGSPESICGRVEHWIHKNSKSKLLSEAWLLLGRLYADSWWLYTKHTFITKGGVAQLDGLGERSERTKGKGLAAFRQVFEKFRKSSHASAARREYDLLKNNKDDGVMYGISY